MIHNRSKRIAVVLADDAPPEIARVCIEAFSREVEGRGEVIVVGRSPSDGRRSPLVPELWARGLEAADAPLVAFSTTRMVPARGWLNAMLRRLDETGAAGVGGPILPGNGLSPFDRALYLQRWSKYATPFPPQAPTDPPGENAIYRREHLNALRPFWAEGFWEVEIQRLLKKGGGRFQIAEQGVVHYGGGARPALTLGQRFRHARRYGSERAQGETWSRRLLRVVAAPAVPPVMMARSILTQTARNRPVGPWASSLPALALIVSSWAAGEAVGTLIGPGPVRRRAISPLSLSRSMAPTSKSAEALVS